MEKNIIFRSKKIINWCENAGLVCVLEIHDHTGSDNPSDLKMWAVEYWNEMKNLLNAHKKYVIVNIANEWLGSWNKGSIWAQTYIDVVKILRVIGIQNALMVDASGYGQESGPIIENAKKVLEADPNKNVIFSYHVYSSLGKNKNTLYTAFDKLKNTGVCWIAGEFGWYHQGVYIPYKDLMEYCQKNGIGWLAWSWTGNSGDDSPLDITSVNTFSKNDLSFWGKDIFYGKNGIQNTSKKAYEENNTNFGYCDGCEVTETGSDGTKWGYENGKSCLINTNKCDSSDPGTAPNGFPYCSACDVTTLTSDGTRWGWENNNSCVINESKC